MRFHRSTTKKLAAHPLQRVGCAATARPCAGSSADGFACFCRCAPCSGLPLSARGVERGGWDCGFGGADGRRDSAMRASRIAMVKKKKKKKKASSTPLQRLAFSTAAAPCASSGGNGINTSWRSCGCSRGPPSGCGAERGSGEVGFGLGDGDAIHDGEKKKVDQFSSLFLSSLFIDVQPYAYGCPNPDMAVHSPQ